MAFVSVLILNFCCIGLFSRSSFLVIYFWYESSLLPIIYLITYYGGYTDRLVSRVIMLMFTSVFSLPLMISVWVFFTYCGSDNFYLINIIGLESLPWWICVMGIVGFRVKLPLYGIHQWLPIAHVEAPTYGSTLLAGLLLKLGGCALFRCYFFLNGFNFVIVVVGLIRISLIYSVCCCCMQSDYKRLVAYSSVFHITFMFFVFTSNFASCFLILLVVIVTHGLTSPLMFGLVGATYSIYGSRLIINLGGLLRLAPFLFFLSLMSFLLNVPTPPFVSFLVEVFRFICLVSIYIYSHFIIFTILFIVIVLSLCYNLI